MQTVSVSQLKKSLSAYLRLVQGGEMCSLPIEAGRWRA